MMENVYDKINTSVPVSIIELPDSQFNLKKHNEFITHAKLKIFYIGETGDGRLFTEDFSNKLIKTLPQSPVVGYYDEDSDDFRAHNYKQYVYGYVPENATISFEEEGDKVWAYTDVILFTGRNDNIGEVARKIIGMQHSLELDPNSVEYQINYTTDGKFQNIEFTNGKFIGLSVVGDSEKPAFSGSHFFTIEEEGQMLKAFQEFQGNITSLFECSGMDKDGIGLCVFRSLDDLDLKPTETMANNAKRGLALRQEHGRGGTAVGVARARDLANRKNLSPQTVQRMYSYFSRHEVDKKGSGWNADEEGYPSAGLIAWLLWGGDAGYRWAESKYNQIKKVREDNMTEISLREFDLKESEDGGENMDITEKDNVQPVVVDVIEEIVEQEPEVVQPEPEVEVQPEPEVETPVEEVQEELHQEPVVEDFMKTPYDEIQEDFVKSFREAHGEYAYIVQWSSMEDIVVYWNGQDQKYYRESFVMDEATQTINFNEPVVVKLRYLTEEEIDSTFVEETHEQVDQGGQSEQEEHTQREEGLVLSKGEAEQLEKDMAELQAFRKAGKIELINSFKDLVDEKVLEEITLKVDEFTAEELDTKLSVEAMKKIKAEKEEQKAQTINPVKFYTGVNNNHTNENPVATLVDQWKDKK